MTTIPSAASAEAFNKATSGTSTANYRAIFEGFAELGILQVDILPRENVLTFKAWKCLGRVVKKGAHGVRVVVFVPSTRTDPQTGDVRVGRRPWMTTVFHISQTEELQ
jgi:antirestriction protein ArdC